MEKTNYQKILDLISTCNEEEAKELKSYLDMLEDDSLFLNTLESNGVDNWEWYDEAVEEYNQYKEGE